MHDNAYLPLPTTRTLRYIKLTPGFFQVRLDDPDGHDISVGYLTDTRATWGNTQAQRWQTSDGERFARLDQAKQHELQAQVLPYLRCCGYLPPAPPAPPAAGPLGGAVALAVPARGGC